MNKCSVLFVIFWFGSMEGTMKLTSSAFYHNGMIPSSYTCDGANISPELQWTDIPEGTKSLALIVDDPDAPAKVWVHWIVFNIPVTITRLEKNADITAFVGGATDFNGAQKYGGPCPPSGTHHYRFTLYALNIMLDLKAGVSKEQVLSAMNGHILDQTTLIGGYQKR